MVEQESQRLRDAVDSLGLHGDAEADSWSREAKGCSGMMAPLRLSTDRPGSFSLKHPVEKLYPY
jgi:hypothetical protein